MRVIQNSFVNGEVSPHTMGRQDIELFYQTAKDITNFTVLQTGGLKKRSGTQLMWGIEISDLSYYRMVPFFYDRTKCAIILFYTKTSSNFLYYKFLVEGELEGAEAYISSDIPGNGPPGAPIDAIAEDLRYTQIGDTIFCSSPNCTAFYGKVNFDSLTIAWQKMRSSLDIETPNTTITNTKSGFGSTSEGYVNATRIYGLIGVKDSVYSPALEQTVAMTLPWKAGATISLSFTPDWDKFDCYYLCLKISGQWQILNSYYEGDSCTLVDDNLTSGNTVGVMEPLSVGNGQMDVNIIDTWEQRLVMASSSQNPFSVWFSRIGDVFNFYTTRPVNADDAFEITIPVTVASRILHTITNRFFFLFTESGEYQITSGGNGFAYNTIAVKKTSSIGAHEGIVPVNTDSSTIFCAADGRTVYELLYALEQDNIIPKNRSFIASHLSEKHAIKKIGYIKFPVPSLLCLLENGDMIRMTYAPEEKVYSWSKIKFSNEDFICVDFCIPGNIREGEGFETSSDVYLVFVNENQPERIFIERFRTNTNGQIVDIGKAKCADHCGYQNLVNYDAWFDKDPQQNVDAHVITRQMDAPQFISNGIFKNIAGAVIKLNRSGEIIVQPDDDRVSPSRSSLQTSATPTFITVDDVDYVNLISKDVQLLPFAYQNTEGRMRIISNDEYPCEILSVIMDVNIADLNEGGK